jgi:acetyltransferase-like isoleucine patch superfamily enzyme
MGSIVCFPYGSHVNARHIHLGHDTMIAPWVILSTGWGPGHEGLPDEVLTIGDRCLIGQGTSIVAHLRIDIGDDVWTGFGCRLTDMNHGYEDVRFPCSVQAQPMRPIAVGSGSWLGHHVVVLPGVTIGRNVVVGAGSVVTKDLPDYSVAVGVPARVVRRWKPGVGWCDVGPVGGDDEMGRADPTHEMRPATDPRTGDELASLLAVLEPGAGTGVGWGQRHDGRDDAPVPDLPT